MAHPSYRTPLLWLLLPIMAGYILGNILPGLPVFPTLGLAVICLLVAYRLLNLESGTISERIWPIFFLIGVSATALLYYQDQKRFPENWEILPAREANLQLKVNRLYASVDPSRFTGIAKITGTDDHLVPLTGFPIYFSVTSEEAEIGRGQIISTKGILNYLPAKESPSLFEQYLLGQSVALTFTRARLTDLPQNGSALETIVGSLRSRAIDILGIELIDYPDPLSIYRGMMLGIKGELSNENKQLFLTTGTLHLFAISGLHVGIIAVSFAGIFLVLRIPKQISVVMGLSLVYLYVEITGASPSAVRAFAMTAFFWVGRSLVRQMPPFQALIASAVTVLVMAPTQLFSSGFQLSYTVVSGILLWGIPLFQSFKDYWRARELQKLQHLSKVRKIYNQCVEGIVGTFCISLSASLASAPLSILYFGLVAPLAVFLNILLIPIASLIIVSGLFSLISGFSHLDSVAGYCNHGPLVLITITNHLLDRIVEIPGAFVLMAWEKAWLAYITVLLFLGGILTLHGMHLGKVWKFTFPALLSLCMILLNHLPRFFLR